MDDELKQYLDMWDTAKSTGEFEIEQEDDSEEAPLMDDELNSYRDMWDDAQADIEAEATEEEAEGEAPDAYYWKKMELLHEAKKEKVKSKKSPNPVYPDSVGKDSKRPKTTKEEDALKEVDKLKRKLYELECDLLGKEAGGNKWQDKPKDFDDDKDNKNLDKINKMKEELDELSNDLGFGDETAKSVYGFTDEEVK